MVSAQAPVLIIKYDAANRDYSESVFQNRREETGMRIPTGAVRFFNCIVKFLIPHS